MDFSSSDSPEEGLGAGDGVSGRPVAGGSTGGVHGVAKVVGEAGRGVLRVGKQGHSVSAELIVGVGRWLESKGDLLEKD